MVSVAKIIKEYADMPVVGNRRFCIRMSGYGRTLQAILELWEIAKADFPQLTMEDVEIMYYAGDRFARTYGLEFGLDVKPPDGYKEISELERTF